MVAKKRGSFLLLLGLVLLLFSVISVTAAEGCYTYLGNDESLYCQPNTDSVDAQVDCDNFEDCDMTIHFLTGSDCSDVPNGACEEIRCDVDCDFHAREWCKQLGLQDQFREGSEVTDFDQQCTPGCCKVEKEGFSSCNYGSIFYQCDLRAIRAGVPLNDRTFIIKRMDANICQAKVCQRPTSGTLVTGTILDNQNNPIPNTAVVTVIVEGTNKQGVYVPASGTYSIENLRPGSHRIRATATGFTPKTSTVEIELGQETVNFPIVLSPLDDLATLKGTVVDMETGDGIDAVISWGSRSQERTSATDLGNFEITLEEGPYTLTVSKSGYSPKDVDVVARKGVVVNLNPIELQKLEFQGVRGITSVDLDGFEIFLPQPAVKLFVNGIFKGFSQVGGQYELALEEGEHTIIARFQRDKVYESEPLIVEIELNTVLPRNLQLSAEEGECDEEGEEKNVEGFSGEVVRGKKEVLLHWAVPCPGVQSYEIRKYLDDQQVGSVIIVPGNINRKIDNKNLDFGLTYRYEIVTKYDNDRRSPAPSPSVPVTIGQEICNGKYNEETGQWGTFCDRFRPKIILTCNNQNNLAELFDCTERDLEGEKDFYCARISENEADCKDAGVCLTQNAHPFGLYHTSEMCYGTNEPQNGEAINYCVFDSSKRTITNSCKACTEIESCFDYRSKDACQINNCAKTSCSWVDGASLASEDLIDYSAVGIEIPNLYVSPETGTGYCVEDGFKGNKCSLCGPDVEDSELFENYFCTADVCTNLGRCFSNHPSQGEILSSCIFCEEIPTAENNCYSYTSELECSKGNSVQELDGSIVPSEDVCGWGRCLWDETKCVKDGDGNDDDDCQSFTDREKVLCEIDNVPPVTTIIPDGFRVVSGARPNITFKGEDDNNPMGSLHYCLNSILASGECELPNVGELYLGRQREETVTLNIFESEELTGRLIPGETFLLRFFSKDKYFNQENVKETFIFVDNVKPEFLINEENTTTKDQTDLTVYLEGLEEPAKCTFLLTRTLPAGNTRQDIVLREVVDKRVVYTGLDGIGYLVNVTCEDDYGNLYNKHKNYVFDLEERINIIHPPLQGVIAETRIVFNVQTEVGAICGLFTADNQKIADFQTDETGKEHTSPRIPGFFEREYVAEHKVICNELLDENEVFEEYFNFKIDFTPPETRIVLKEGSREVRPIIYGWEEFFISKVSTDFECLADDGFGCDKTFYCLGEGCEFIGNENYQEYSGTLEIDESTLICYYSSDVADNTVFQPVCGNIFIEGFGIQLEKPLQHEYREEMWGVSSTPNFVWQFSTKIPTTECKFDFKSNFDYDKIPAHKTKTPNADGKYIFENFPESVFTSYSARGGVKTVYVKCVNVDGDFSPEQKMNLEYDPTNPSIKDAFADPNPVLDGITTNLFVSTDDKTLCRYNDDSGGSTSEYSTMGFSFPGEDRRVLGEVHEDIFNINFLGDKKTFTLNTQCINGAGLLSQVEEIKFDVDYSAIGNIIFVFPNKDYFNKRDVTLRVETSKEAICEYSLNRTYMPFETNDGISHSKQLIRLDEGEYLIPVKCTMGDRVAQARISFIVDLTPPLITEVEDGNFTCGAETINVFVNSNETNVTGHTYEIYDRGFVRSDRVIRSGREDRGSATNTRTFTQRVKILNGSNDGHSPIIIPTKDLTENNTYTVVVTAHDAAGNSGKSKESDGVTVIGKNNTICISDNSAPRVEYVVDGDSSCRTVTVEMKCKDKLGCNFFKYGTHKTADLCKPERSYSGRKIEFSEAGFVCIFVEDVTGNNFSETKKVNFIDDDGDGILDDCDVCEETNHGRITGIDGCSDGQIPIGENSFDTDGDSLPNNWELNYDSVSCPLDPNKEDSDDNGLTDNLEDYDDDGRSNFEEYLDDTDPCVKDQKSIKDPVAKPPILTPGGDDIINEENIVAWVFLIVGVALMLSGIGYLIYFYRAPSKSTSTSLETSPILPGLARPSTPTESIFSKKLSRGKRRRLQRSKTKNRQSLFGSFNKDSKNIPHVGKLFGSKNKSPANLKKVANKYLKHKDKIKPGLRNEEKSVFAKLEGVVKQHKGKKIDTVNKKEAENIFSRLKKISDKRKK